MQFPTFPFAGGCEASQGLGKQVADVRMPNPQLVTPESLKPVLQTGRHVDPEAREFVQFPGCPFPGAVEALQGIGRHLADVNVPKLQLEMPARVYPLLQIGTQVCE